MSSPTVSFAAATRLLCCANHFVPFSSLGRILPQRKPAAGLSVLKRNSIARAPLALCLGVGVTRTCVAYNHVLTQSLGWSSLP